MPDDKISRAKAVDICADMIFAGKQTGEIVLFFAETYGRGRSSVEKCIRAARPLVAERQQAALQVQRKLDEETLTDIAKKLGISIERVAREYAKIGFSDIRKVFNDDGGLKEASKWDDDTAGAISSIETHEVSIEGVKIGDTRKVKAWNKKDGLDGLCKIFGYTIPKDDDPPPTDLSALPITFK